VWNEGSARRSSGKRQNDPKAAFCHHSLNGLAAFRRPWRKGRGRPPRWWRRGVPALAPGHGLRYWRGARRDKERAMPAEISPLDKARIAAARREVDEVENGMKLGLGTGGTASWMVRCLARRIRNEGLRIRAVPTS